METRSKQRRETVPALQAIKSLRKLKRMLSLVEVVYVDPAEIDWSELDANADRRSPYRYRKDSSVCDPLFTTSFGFSVKENRFSKSFNFDSYKRTSNSGY